MSLDDKGVILLEQEMHLFHLLRRERLDNIELVVWQVELGPAPPRRIHGLGAFRQRLQVRAVVDAKALAEVTEDQGTIFFDLEKKKRKEQQKMKLT